MKIAFLGLISQNMHISAPLDIAFMSEIEPSSLSSDVSIVMLPLVELLLDVDVVSKEIDLPNLVKSRLADGGATTSVSVSSNISNS